MSSSSSSSKKGGFQHNSVYKFVSMKDKHVIEMTGTGTLTTKKGSNAASQKFKTVEICEGDFRVSPTFIIGSAVGGTASSTAASAGDQQVQVWDINDNKSPPILILSESVASDCANQSWIAVEIYPNSKICFIKTKKDGLCLKNMGSGKPITLVPEDRRDSRTLWRLELSAL